MIDQLLEEARRRGAEGADALWRRVERTTIAFEWGRLKAAGVNEEAGVNLRVVRNGKVGVAGSTAVDGAGDLVSRALESAELGEAVELALPPGRTLPQVTTAFPKVESAPLQTLIAIGQELVDGLARDGCQVNVTIEREVGETDVGNTAGARGGYKTTGVGVSADVWRVAGDDVLAISDAFDGADLPDKAAIGGLLASINKRLESALTIAAPPEGSLPVVFTPAGLSAILLPITQALSGKAVLQGISPLAAKVGERVFDQTFSLTDDPLTPGRPQSRPLDDECVPSATTRLVQRGVVHRFVYDLETAARARAASTGHGRRGIFSKPVPSYTNIIVGAGHAVPVQDVVPVLGGGLLRDVKDGLLVDDLIGVGQGNVISGAFSHPVALAYRIVNGEITGRVKDAAVAGNAYELLKRIGGWGSDARWYGSRLGPSLRLEGVSVARR